MDVEQIVSEALPAGFKARAYRDRTNADGVMEVQYHAGDWKGIWDPTNREEVEATRSTFDKLKSKGFLAYKVIGEKGDKGEVIRDFDPKAGRIIMTPPMVGG